MTMHASLWARCGICALALAAVSSAGTYYVSPTGADSSGTTCCTPMSIEQAFGRTDYPAGPVVYILRGEYRKQDGSGYQLSVGASNVSFVGVAELFCEACTASAAPAPPRLRACSCRGR